MTMMSATPRAPEALFDVNIPYIIKERNTIEFLKLLTKVLLYSRKRETKWSEGVLEL